MKFYYLYHSLINMYAQLHSGNRDGKFDLILNRYYYFVLFVCLLLFFYLILNDPSTIFQLNRDGSSWVEPVLS